MYTFLHTRSLPDALPILKAALRMEMQCPHRSHHHPARLEENPLMVAHAHPVIVNRITEHAARERDLAGRQDTRRSRHPSLFLRRVRRALIRASRAHVAHVHPAMIHRRRSEEHTSELQSLMRISYAVFCL